MAYFTALLNRLLRILVRASLSTGALKSCSGRSVLKFQPILLGGGIETDISVSY